MASAFTYLDRCYLTERTVREPTTLIECVEWDDDVGEARIRFVDEARVYAMRDDDRDWLTLQAITGEREAERMKGCTVRLYPVNYPEPDLELF